MTKLKKNTTDNQKRLLVQLCVCGERRVPIPLCLFSGHMTLRLTLNRPPILTVDDHYDEDDFVDCQQLDD